MTLFNCSDLLCGEIVDNSSSFNNSIDIFELSKTNTDSEYVYVILTAVTSGLSIIGGATICILYVSFRDIRTPSRTLLFFLAFSDTFLAFGNLLGVLWYLYSGSKTLHKSHGYCAFQSAMTIYFSCTSFFWTVIMALNLFHAVVLKNATFAANYMKLFHLLAWLPPGIIVTVALAMDVLGTDTTLDQASWCWIDPRTPNVLVWQFATGKFWEILAYVAVVNLYMTIKVFLKKQELKKKTLVGRGSVKKRKDVISEANRKLTFVPFVFIVCRIWGTLRFLLGNFAVDHINEPYVTWINPLQGIGDSAQGFANCVLYCLSTEKIRQRLVRTICPSRLIPVNTSESRTESNSKYKKNIRVGIDENISQSYADIGPSQVEKEQSVLTTETNDDQTSSDPTVVSTKARVTTVDKLKTDRKDGTCTGNDGEPTECKILINDIKSINNVVDEEEYELAEITRIKSALYSEGNSGFRTNTQPSQADLNSKYIGELENKKERAKPIKKNKVGKISPVLHQDTCSNSYQQNQMEDYIRKTALNISQSKCVNSKVKFTQSPSEENETQSSFIDKLHDEESKAGRNKFETIESESDLKERSDLACKSNASDVEAAKNALKDPVLLTKNFHRIEKMFCISKEQASHKA